MANTGFILFRNITIPENSEIIKAVVVLTGFLPLSGIDTNILCYFEDSDNPGPPSDKTDLDGRSLTDSIDWNNIEKWEDNLTYQSPNLASIFQTVIDRINRVSGDSALFLLKDNGSTSYRIWSAIEHRGGVERAELRVSWKPPKKISTPEILPVEQFHPESFKCSIRVFPNDANIYYTIDGSDPDEGSTLYSSPFSVVSNITVKAKAYKQYWTPSDIASRPYTTYFQVNNNQTYMRLGYGTGANVPGAETIISSGYILFNNVTIPQGAVISSAYIRFYNPDFDRTDSVDIDISFNATDDANKIGDAIIFRDKVDNHKTSTVTWNITETHNADTWYNSIDIAAIFQEIIDRPGWTSGNKALVFLDVLPHYAFERIGDVRIMEQRASTGVQDPPELHVVWDTGSGTFYTVDYDDDGEVPEAVYP